MFVLFVFFVTCFCKDLRAPVYTLKNAIPNRYIVVFKDSISSQVLEQEHTNAKALFGDRIKFVYKLSIKGFAVEVNPISRELSDLRRNPNVEFIETDHVVKVSECKTEEDGSWGQTRIAQKMVNLDGQFQSHGRGKAVNAYILDTGIYLAHTDFQGRATFGFKAEASWKDTDSNGHGTHVSSTVGGKKYGIAKDVSLIAVKVLGDDGSGSNAGVIAGIEYALDQHINKGVPSVANMSLGGGKSTALNRAVDKAVSSNLVFIVAAGNDNSDACNYSPASAIDAITVGATDIGDVGNNQVDIRSYFSNFGTCVDILAPGTGITGAWIGTPTATRTISGTSMASPHVCGMAAVLLGLNPKMTWNAVKNQLTSDASVDFIDLQCSGSTACLNTPNLLAYNGCDA